MAGCAPSLAVPPVLVATWPSPNATLPVTRQSLELTFNRPLDPATSWASVWRDEDGVPLASRVYVDHDSGNRLWVNLVAPTAGQYRLRWHAVTAASLAASDGEQAFSLQGESDTAPRLQVSPPLAESNDIVTLSGSGFGGDTTVRLTIGDDDVPLAMADTDHQGRFSVDTRVPPSVAYGVQPINAHDRWGDTASTVLSVRWGGWPPVLAFTTGQPGPGPGEVTISLSLRNRSDYVLEHVAVTMNQPADTEVVAVEPAPTRRDTALTWMLPLVDRGVVGPLRATFRVDHPITTHARIEFRHRRAPGCRGDLCLPAFVSETTTDSSQIAPLD